MIAFRIGVRYLLGICVCVVAAQNAIAQQVAGTRYEFPRQLNAATRATLEYLADSARDAGLPTELLVAKSAEGVLKGADDARILVAVRLLVRELGVARGALPADVRAGTLAAAASALHAGVPAATLRRLWDGRGRKPDENGLAVALVTLADLVASRVPPETAVASVEQLLARRATDSEMSAFRAAVAEDIAAGRSPGDAASEQTRSYVRRLDVRGRGREPRPPS